MIFDLICNFGFSECLQLLAGMFGLSVDRIKVVKIYKQTNLLSFKFSMKSSL